MRVTVPQPCPQEGGSIGSSLPGPLGACLLLQSQQQQHMKVKDFPRQLGKACGRPVGAQTGLVVTCLLPSPVTVGGRVAVAWG